MEEPRVGVEQFHLLQGSSDHLGVTVPHWNSGEKEPKKQVTILSTWEVKVQKQEKKKMSSFPRFPPPLPANSLLELPVYLWRSCGCCGPPPSPSEGYLPWATLLMQSKNCWPFSSYMYCLWARTILMGSAAKKTLQEGLRRIGANTLVLHCVFPSQGRSSSAENHSGTSHCVGTFYLNLLFMTLLQVCSYLCICCIKFAGIWQFYLETIELNCFQLWSLKPRINFPLGNFYSVRKKNFKAYYVSETAVYLQIWSHFMFQQS